MSITTAMSNTTARSLDLWSIADEILVKMADLPPDHSARAGLREQAICQCLPEARREAARFRYTGEAFDDLLQVAAMALVLAVDRFQPSRGVAFKHFAQPTISGELKRHLRDRRWGIRLTRRIQDLCLERGKAEPLLSQRLGRTPTTKDLAEYLGVSEVDILAARCGQAAHSPWSLQYPVAGGDGAELGDQLGSADREMEGVADHDALVRAWSVLPDRLRVLLTLRFVEELSQQQIAQKLGISQMHVSRLLARSLAMLRRHMVPDESFAA
jgi:RNA polymerase sigma-B factor